MVHYENDFQSIPTTYVPTTRTKNENRPMLRMCLGGETANLSFTKIFVDKAKWSNKTNRMICSTAEAQPVEKYTLLSPRWPVEFDSCLNSIPSCFIGNRR